MWLLWDNVSVFYCFDIVWVIRTGSKLVFIALILSSINWLSNYFPFLNKCLKHIFILLKLPFFEIRYFVAKREIHSMWTGKWGHILGLHLKEVIKDKSRVPWYLSQEFLRPYFMDRVQWRKMNIILRRTLSPQAILLIHLQCLQVCPFWVQSRLSQCFIFFQTLTFIDTAYKVCLKIKDNQSIKQTNI